ncbi:hypothetical protein EK21DRAFT_106750 [Setomelanomma holmii]|uniref:Uncharacterized protein n=1 Tax=Setomelanomma holmii TaxID=210430 RepID=A0A9P4LS12_9PLEO|nr:hypothetical protein EK21DRAFT_106750 [Setomelanomma holmii]
MSERPIKRQRVAPLYDRSLAIAKKNQHESPLLRLPAEIRKPIFTSKVYFGTFESAGG